MEVGAQEGFLDHVLGFRPVLQHVLHGRQQPVLVLPDQLAVRLLVALGGRRQ